MASAPIIIDLTFNRCVRNGLRITDLLDFGLLLCTDSICRSVQPGHPLHALDNFQGPFSAVWPKIADYLEGFYQSNHSTRILPVVGQIVFEIFRDANTVMSWCEQ